MCFCVVEFSNKLFIFIFILLNFPSIEALLQTHNLLHLFRCIKHHLFSLFWVTSAHLYVHIQHAGEFLYTLYHISTNVHPPISSSSFKVLKLLAWKKCVRNVVCVYLCECDIVEVIRMCFHLLFYASLLFNALPTLYNTCISVNHPFPLITSLCLSHRQQMCGTQNSHIA